MTNKTNATYVFGFGRSNVINNKSKFPKDFFYGYFDLKDDVKNVNYIEFETDIGKYGEYLCRGSILYNDKSKLENMYFACEFIDQLGDVFINMGKRLKGSDSDRAVGKMNIIEGNGFWEKYIGYECTYAVEYVNKTIFAPTVCKR